MTLYVLDTDIMGFAFQRHPTVLQRLQHLPEDDLVVTTIITFADGRCTEATPGKLLRHGRG